MAHDKQFKERVLRMLHRGEATRTELSEDLGISRVTLWRWQKEHETKPLTAKERRELDQLRRESKRLRMELDILKKFQAFCDDQEK